MLSTDDFLIVVYNFLEVGSKYRSDLVDLFGTPDGSRKGYIGSEDEPIRWDWGETGFRKAINVLYCLSGGDQSRFLPFYHSDIFHKEHIVQSLIGDGIIDNPPRMLYVFKHSSKKIPAFVAIIRDISWIKGRVWITFEPREYALIDPNSWKEFWGLLFTAGREDPRKWFDTWERSWNAPRPPLSSIEQMLRSSFTQDQYHVIPTKLLVEKIKVKVDPSTQGPRAVFIKDITKIERRLKLRVPTDNQAFWGILSEFIGKTQVRGTVELRYDKKDYAIEDIPANTISEDSLVFKQEIGTARTICQAMLDVFGEDYLSMEFAKGIRKSILDSVFLNRSIKVSKVASEYEREYGDTDYDYQLDLSHLYIKHDFKSILFDLTAGLWNKGIGKSTEEYLELWEHNLIKIPEMNEGLCVIWHYGLLSETKDGCFKGQEVGDYLRSKAISEVIKYQKDSIIDALTLPKTVLLPFFRDSDVRLEKELNDISSDKEPNRRHSKLYGASKELLEFLKI